MMHMLLLGQSCVRCWPKQQRYKLEDDAARPFSGMTMGYWGAVTSDYDFCEKNYALSNYVAEFFSTFSSIPIILYGFYFLMQCVQYKHNYKLILSSFGVIVVGIGSFVFHGTMKRTGQMLDEIPMLWCSLFMLYTSLALFRFSNPSCTKWLGALLLCFGMLNTALYFVGGFVYFISSYIMTVAMVVFTTIYHAMQKSSDKKLQQFAFRAILFYAGGFFVLWLPEQVLCGNQLLPDAPVSSLSELPIPLHAFFHFTSALGPYYWLTFAVYKDLHINKQEHVDVAYYRNYLSIGVALPVVEPKTAKQV